MTFLAPVPAIVAAAVAVPAVLVLYFLKLRRRPVRVGTTMLWRQAAEDLQANVPFRMLRPSVLLLVQLLILALLLLALARPAIDATGAMPARVFVVIDRSASMRATDMPDGQTRFAEAVRLATRAVERVTAGNSQSQITLIAFAAEPEIVAGPTGSRADLLRGAAPAHPQRPARRSGLRTAARAGALDARRRGLEGPAAGGRLLRRLDRRRPARPRGRPPIRARRAVNPGRESRPRARWPPGATTTRPRSCGSSPASRARWANPSRSRSRSPSTARSSPAAPSTPCPPARTGPGRPPSPSRCRRRARRC
ncbi:MAG: VWA domain-containing protein [Planctomycetota bacterium]|nr:MAG: VWA domain-containing protein [Planctomycetota bacterium]